MCSTNLREPEPAPAIAVTRDEFMSAVDDLRPLLAVPEEGREAMGPRLLTKSYSG